MTYPEHTRALLRLGMPLAGGNLAQIVIGMTDSLMLGWYSVEALAAVTIASSVFFILMIVGSGFAWAATPMIAAAEEEGEEREVRAATRMALWLSVIWALAAIPLMWWSGPLLRMLGQTPEIADLAQSYLRIAGWAMIPALIAMTLRAYLSALERTQIVLWTTLGAAVLNVALNYVLIFGHFGAPALGIRGAAIASLLITTLVTLALALYAARIFPAHAIFLRLWRADWACFGRVFRLGWPIGLTNFAETGLFVFAALMMGWIGAETLAAHGAAIQLSAATFVIHLGLSQAATVRAGRAAVRGDATRLRRGAHVAFALSAAFALLTAAGFLIAPEALIGVFVDPDDPRHREIVRVGAGLLMIAAAFQVVDAMQVIALGLLRGLSDTRTPMMLAAISYWPIGMVAAYILGFPMGLEGRGVWLGLLIGLTVAAILLGLRFRQRAAMLAPVENLR